MGSEQEIKAAFDAANAFVASSKKGEIDLSNSDKLMFYALYKQSTVGPCSGKQPSRMQIVARAKFDAWNSLKQMSKKDAQLKFIEILAKKNPKFQPKL